MSGRNMLVITIKKLHSNIQVHLLVFSIIFFCKDKFLNCSHNITQYLKYAKLFLTCISLHSEVTVVAFCGEKNSDGCCTSGGKTE
jgi:hypothetical protein